MAQWNVIPQYVVDDPFGYQSANRFVDNMIALAARRAGRTLGGSRSLPMASAFDLELGEFHSLHYGVGPYPVMDYADVEIDGTSQVGFTYRARVQCLVRGPIGFSVTPVIRNVTDATDAGTGVACTATDPEYGGTNQKQTITLTIASGIKTYRLTYLLNGPTGDVWVSGEVEAFATA